MLWKVRVNVICSRSQNRFIVQPRIKTLGLPIPLPVCYFIATTHISYGNLHLDHILNWKAKRFLNASAEYSSILWNMSVSFHLLPSPPDLNKVQTQDFFVSRHLCRNIPLLLKTTTRGGGQNKYSKATIFVLIFKKIYLHFKSVLLFLFISIRHRLISTQRSSTEYNSNILRFIGTQICKSSNIFL